MPSPAGVPKLSSQTGEWRKIILFVQQVVQSRGYEKGISMKQPAIFAGVLSVGAFALLTASQAQPPFGSRAREVVSPEISPEKKVTFRIYAPKAEEVRAFSSDMPEVGSGIEMKKGDSDIWEATVGPVPPGAYRYNFNVDSVSVIDPHNPSTSESNSNTWSLIYVPGSEISDAQQVPRGAVAKVTYYSETLQRFRRFHVYTPPGYENGEGTYPVLYLLHGALDCDESWSSVGRAGFILDNLIAAGKAKPMIVVMPAGHTGPFRFGPPGDGSFQRQMDEFSEDFIKDLKPYVEKNYRILDNQANRAIAGLSMGGAQTLNVAFDNLNEFGYIGVFSSGIFGIAGGFGGAPPSTQWEDSHKVVLDDAERKEGLRLLWFSTGKDDFLLRTSTATVEMLKKHGFDVVYQESEGGHTWTNWRNYLHQFAPLLFTEN
jgi:enterochelin esterase family protein